MLSLWRGFCADVTPGFLSRPRLAREKEFVDSVQVVKATLLVVGALSPCGHFRLLAPLFFVCRGRKEIVGH